MMGPIEIVWGSLVIVFIFIGIVRGFLKEIGVTTILCFMLFILTYFRRQVAVGLDLFLTTIRVTPLDSVQANMVRWGVYAGLLVFIAFISYQGETLAFEGNPLRGPLGIALGAIAGLLNGYLIAGTLWYYLDLLKYPISLFGLFQQPLSSAARSILPLLPEALIPPFGFLAIAAFLIFMRVIR